MVQRCCSTILENGYNRPRRTTAYTRMDIDTDLPTAYKNLFTKFDKQEREGYGWMLDKILQIEVHTATLDPIDP